jgi:hypothetical protein
MPEDDFVEFEWYIGADFMAVVINGKLWFYGEEYEYMKKLVENPLPAASISVAIAPKATVVVDYLRVTEI